MVPTPHEDIVPLDELHERGEVMAHLADVLGSDGDEVGREIEQEDEKTELLKLVGELPPREKQIMQMRFGMGGYDEYTQKEVADVLGISQSYISRLEKRIISKLKKQIEKLAI